MSAYKQFTTKDVTITPFDPNKLFSYTGNEITGSNVGIEIYSGVKPTTNIFVSASATPTGRVFIENTTGVYNSIKQLYYTNYLSSSTGDNVPTQSVIPGISSEFDEFVGAIEAPRFENYLQSTLTQSRFFPTSSFQSISVVSIPSKLYGNNIVPQTFELHYTHSTFNVYNIKDDGEGNLIIDSTASVYPVSASYGTGSYGTGSYGYTTSSFIGHLNDVVGQIFYSHGIATFTTGAHSEMGNDIDTNPYKLERFGLSYSSSVRIYENQYKCSIRENEFDYSLNPSLLSGSKNDTYYDFATGSYFCPYVTSVGLYNENNELLVVGKLSTPVPISQYVDTTIIVNFDLF
jgi:hypothetical protein